MDSCVSRTADPFEVKSNTFWSFPPVLPGTRVINDDVHQLTEKNMFRRMIKHGLIAGMVVSFGFQAQATETQVTLAGEATAKIASYSEDDGTDSVSYIDGEAEATMRFNAVVSEGEWKGSGHAIFSFDEDAPGGNNFIAKHRWVTLQNNATAFSLGYWRPGAADIALGKGYLDTIDESLDIGNEAFKGTGFSYFKFGYKPVGVELTAGVNRVDCKNDGLFSATLISAKYENSFSDLDLVARLTSVSEAIDEKQNPAGKNGPRDGATKSEIGVGVGYNIGEMLLAANLSQFTDARGGSPAPDAVSTTIFNLVFDMGLNEESGITISYANQKVEDENTAQIDLGYLRTIAGVDVSVGYTSTITKDDNTGASSASSAIGGGMTLAF
jgi:hypothetical protein